MRKKFPALDLILIESGGDNLAATFSPELADLTIYVIDVSGGEKIPRKGGPGITRSDLLVINKVDLAPHVGASHEVMARDAAPHARRAAVRDDEYALRRRGRRGDGVHRKDGRVDGVAGERDLPSSACGRRRRDQLFVFRALDRLEDHRLRPCRRR